MWPHGVLLLPNKHACPATVPHTEVHAIFIAASGAAGAGAAAAAAEAQGLVNRRGRISTSGLDTSESAADSEDADAILPMPMHMSIGSPTAAAAAAGDVPARGVGRRSRGRAAGRTLVEDGRSEVAHDVAAKGASYYRRLRRERRQPAAGELICDTTCVWDVELAYL
jgi:predicted metal-dependent HD superfamily phosphohydrolase